VKSSLRFLIAVTLLFSESVKAIGSSSNSQAADRVAQTRDKWLAAFKSKDVTSAVAFYASNAAFLEPTGDRIEGSKAIRELYEKVVSTDAGSVIQTHEHKGDLKEP